MLGFVAAGVGETLIPDMVTRGIRDDVACGPLEPAPPPRPILVALPPGYRSPAAVAMLSVMREVSDEWVTKRVLVTDIGDVRCTPNVGDAAQALD